MSASGVVLGTSVVTGVKAGVGDAVATIQTTLNNQYLIEVAILFIGLCVVLGFIYHIMRHKGTSLGSLDSGGKERAWAEKQSLASYLSNRQSTQRRYTDAQLEQFKADVREEERYI